MFLRPFCTAKVIENRLPEGSYPILHSWQWPLFVKYDFPGLDLNPQYRSEIHPRYHRGPPPPPSSKGRNKLIYWVLIGGCNALQVAE